MFGKDFELAGLSKESQESKQNDFGLELQKFVVDLHSLNSSQAQRSISEVANSGFKY